MTLALNTSTATPIFDQLLADDLAEHFASRIVDTIDAETITVVDTATYMIDGEIVAVVDTPALAPDTHETDYADDHVPSGPIGFPAWLWIITFGVVIGAIIWFAAPPALVVW